MRFDIGAALAIGVLLPALETLRRGWATWGIDFTTMFEDYVAGALLLLGASAALRSPVQGRVLLLVAWSYVTGLMSSSVWYQLEETLRGTVGEPLEVLIVKVLLWSTCIAGVVTAARHLRRPARTLGQ
jgi:hypothetical protein